ncbi:MAG: radical SAM family heme chaperone HemW [Bacteroidota bacterium]|nr:radical SAM family heme chaperone HemW [Bacteroidota bacterium]MDP4234569.1 radical SAM family heme chaperone HemW [Bacteroidota bacterium]MDP4243698.1 radical SAM family heme chaperone HemW [Bacteroidota bacterium]MDP4288354.1 radical SAM family heme chaperone HemW [Bacteroidota bacterium]
MSQQPLSAYLHIPFCERKCVYCDFYSIENLSLRSEFVDLLIREIDMKLTRYPELARRPLQTIFFGGGTPSLLTSTELEHIVAKLDSHFGIANECEFTLECNPGTITIEKLRGYRELGVNRLSFGVQSFDADELRFLGRIHDADESRAAIRLAREAGFDNVSLDLIFALPGQTEVTLRNTLREAIALETDHISAYNLTVEHGTPLYRLVKQKKVIELDPDRAAGLFDLVQQTLSDAGFEQYEISNYARSPETRAKHNLVYWDGFKDYVSFGPSAHEFVSGERAWNVSSLEQYGKMIERGELPRINSERPSLDERRIEVLYVQLRSTGIRLAEFEEAFREALLLHPEVQYFLGDGLLRVDGDLLRLTPQGYRFCDGIVTKLVSHPQGQPSYTLPVVSAEAL